MTALSDLPEIASAPAKSGRSRHPVRKLLVRGFLLGAPFALFLGFFEFRFQQLTPSLYGVKKERLEAQAPKVEVLILGSSQSFMGIDPTLLGRPAFNLAIVSQSLYYDAALLKKYLPSLPSLKAVILPVSCLTLQYELDQGVDPWRTYYYRHFFGVPHRDWHKEFSARNYSAYFLCNERVRAKVLFGTCDNAAYDYDAWGGLTWGFRTNWPPAILPAEDRTPEFLSFKAREALKRHATEMRPQNFGSNLGRLESLLTELDAKGIAVFLITIPTSRFYRQGMQPDAYQLTQNSLAALSRNHHCVYKDYSSDERFADHDFVDGDHLNCRGERKFSLILRDELLASTAAFRGSRSVGP